MKRGRERAREHERATDGGGDSEGESGGSREGDTERQRGKRHTGRKRYNPNSSTHRFSIVVVHKLGPSLKGMNGFSRKNQGFS